MRRFFHWVVEGLVFRRAARAAARAAGAMGPSVERLARLQARADYHEERLKSLLAEHSRLYERVQSEIEDTRRAHKLYEGTIEELREKNNVLNQTIATLVASHQLVLARYDAEIATQVKLKNIGLVERSGE